MADTILKAVRKDDIKSLEILIRNGYPLDIRDNQGFTALHEAAFYNHHSCLEIILQKDKSLIDALAHDNSTPLCVAVCERNVESVQVLLREGADVNKCNNFQQSPLHLAIERNDKEILQVLLNNSVPADLKALDFNDLTPLYFAVSEDLPEIVSILLNKRIGYSIHEFRELILTALPKNNCIKVILEFFKTIFASGFVDILNGPKIGGDTLLAFAVKLGNDEAVSELLAYGADINTDGTFGPPLVTALKQNNFKCVQLLLPHISSQTSTNKCLFRYVRLDADENLLDYLLRNTPALNKAYPSSILNKTPVVCLIHTEDRNFLVTALSTFILRGATIDQVKLFISHGAHVRATYRNEVTPLMAAACSHNLSLVHFLISQGSQLNAYLDGYTFNMSLVSGYDQQVALYLLACGAEVESLFQCDSSKTTFVDYLYLTGGARKEYFVWLLKRAVNFTTNSKLHLTWLSYLEPEDYDHLDSILRKPRSLLHLCTISVRKLLKLQDFSNDVTSLSNYLPDFLLNMLVTCGEKI